MCTALALPTCVAATVAICGQPAATSKTRPPASTPVSHDAGCGVVRSSSAVGLPFGGGGEETSPGYPPPKCSRSSARFPSASRVRWIILWQFAQTRSKPSSPVRRGSSLVDSGAR